MIVIVKPQAPQEKVNEFIQWIESQNFKTHVSTGDYSTIIGLIGDTSRLQEDQLLSYDIVEAVKKVTEPFKQANRKFHPHDTIVPVGDSGLKIGHGNFAMIAGPCSVESEEQVIGIVLDPDSIHVMHKSEFSGLYGDYSTFSDELDEDPEDGEDEE